MPSSYSKSNASSSAQREHNFLSCLLKNAKDSIYFKDRESRFLCLSNTLAKSFGLKSPEQAIGKTDFDYFSPRHAQKAYDDEQKIIQTKQPLIDVIEEELWPDKESTWVSTTKMPFKDNQGNIIGTFGISRNITLRRKAENERDQLQIELQHARKMESIGQLAAGIAHEINTPSQYVSDNLSFLNQSFESLAPLLAALQTTKNLPPNIQDAIDNTDMDFLLEEIPLALSQSQEGTQRISKIVAAMKSFSHPSQGEKQKASLKNLIETAATVAKNEWRYVADLTLNTPNNLKDIPCIHDELSQVIVILLVNAAHAVEQNLEQQDNRKGKITITIQQDNSWSKITITDNGCGIPKHIQDRVFDPFFTTKKIGKGTGQGLNIAYNVIVDKHKGRLLLESEVDQGTSFTIWLPFN